METEDVLRYWSKNEEHRVALKVDISDNCLASPVWLYDGAHGRVRLSAFCLDFLCIRFEVSSLFPVSVVIVTCIGQEVFEGLCEEVVDAFSTQSIHEFVSRDDRVS